MVCAQIWTEQKKTDPVVSNNALNPRCLKGVNVKKLPLQYYANKKAWMTSDVFADWLKWFNLKMCDRKVLLLIDNAPTHVSIERCAIARFFS